MTRAPWLARIGLVLLIVIGVAGVVASLPVLIASAMMFAGPGSKNLLTQLLFVSLIALPLVATTVIVSALFALRNYTCRRAMLPLALLIGWLTCVGTLFAILEWRCDGEFACGKAILPPAVGVSPPLR